MSKEKQTHFAENKNGKIIEVINLPMTFLI